MRYHITHITTYAYAEKISTCHNQVHLAPRSTAWQSCENHRVNIRPEPADRDKRIDYFGNQVEYFVILQPHARLTVSSTSRVTVDRQPPALSDSPPWESVVELLQRDRQQTTLQARQFIYPSLRIPVGGSATNVSASANEPASNGENGDTAASFFEEVRSYTAESFAVGAPLAEGVRDLTRRIHADFVFDGKATTLNTPVEQAFRQRRGVCQDFAHIQIACLRSLGLAARYVSGYLRTDAPPGRPRLVGADASHAWVSVFCGELGWIDFDPTNDVVPTDAHVTVAWGRDYDDVCPIQGVFLGGGKHTMSTSVDVRPE